MFIGFMVYVLLGGGLIMYLCFDVIVLVLMFLYMLSSCFIVIDGNSEIKIFVLEFNDFNFLISCDG